MIDDTEYEECQIRKVDDDGDRWTIARDDGWSFSIAKSHGVVPRVGSTARFYGRGIGFPVRGLSIDGRIAYYRTADEEEAQRRSDTEAREKKERETFEAYREDHDRRIAALPGPFRARFKRFAAGNPDFRWKFEGYELFVCEEAVRLIDRARAAAGAATPSEWLMAFAKADSDTQRKLAPDMKLSEHSGNTFGAAVHLARAYAADEMLVPKLHGALVPLVGCEAYGCTH